MMNTITVLPADAHRPPTGYRAVAGEKESTGPTIGQALDGLAADLPAGETTLVVIQPMTGDAFFTDAQRHRLADLMARWRAARDAGGKLPDDEQAELGALVRDELRAATARSADLLRRLSP